MAAGDLALNILLSANSASATSVISNLGKAISKLGSGDVMGAVGIAAAAAGAAVIGLGIASVKAAGDFQAGMTTLVTGAGESESAIGMVSQGILNMSIATGTSTKQLTDGMYMIESAGYHGAAGLNVLQTAAQGARVGNADLGVVADALTTILTDYHMKASDAAGAMNALTETVASGKTHLQDLSHAMGSVLPLASSLGITFPQVAGAIATMTNAGMSAQRASMNLANAIRSLAAPGATAQKALKEVGISTQQLNDVLTHQGLQQALQMIEDDVGKKFPAGSSQWTAAMKAIMGGATGLNVALMLGGKNMATYRGDITAITGAMQDGKNGVMGWSLVQQDFNFKADQAKQALNVLMITIGTKLLPVIGQIVGAIMPVLANFTTWIGQGDNLRNTLIAVGIVIAALLVPAVWSLAAGVIAATWPFLLIGLAIAGVVLIFKHFYETNAGFKAFIDNIVHGLQQAASFVTGNFMPAMRALGAFFQSSIMPILRDIGSFLLSTFAPVWQQLVSVWNGQILPALQQLWGALQQLQPILVAVGGIVVAAIVIPMGLLWGVLSGLVKALAGVLSGLATFIGGIVQFFSGLIQIVAGVLRFLYDLVTGNFKNLGNDLHGIWQGIVTMFTGVWNMIKGAFQAAIGFVVGLVTGFVQGVVGFFQHLADMIIGHSIVPDMLNAIKNVFQAAVSWLIGLVSGFVSGVINFFSNLWHGAVNIWNMLVAAIRAILMSWIVGAIGLVTNFVSGLQQKWNSLIGIASGIFNNIKNTILGILQNLVGMVFQAGANIVQGIANGIKSAIGAIGDAMGAVGSFISSHLPHSPAKMGPLRDLLMQGQMISQQIGEGIRKGTPHVQAALNATLAPQGSFALATPTNSSPQTINMTVQLDGQTLTKVVGARVAREIRIAGGVRNT